MRRGAAVTGAILVAVLVAVALWFVNKPGASAAKAGDCVTAPTDGKYAKVGCGDAKAVFQVLASFDGRDSNQCDAYPDTTLAVVSSDGAKTLCLKARK